MWIQRRYRITSYNVCYTKLLRQLNRLEKIAEEYTADDGAFSLSGIKDEDMKQAQDILNYLSWRHDGYEIQYGNHDNFDKNIPYMTKAQATIILQTDFYMYDFEREGERYYYVESRGNNRIIDPVNISGYKYLINIDSFDFNNGDIYTFDNYQIDILNVSDDGQDITDSIIRIYENDELVNNISLLECFGDTLMKKGPDFGNEYSDYVYETADKSAKIILFSVEFKVVEEISIIGFSGYILLQ